MQPSLEADTSGQREHEKLIYQIPPGTESCTIVVCNCNQQAASMPSLTHTNPTFQHLWQLHILHSPPSMTVFQVLILTAPLPAGESFYQHTHRPLSTRLSGAEPGFLGPMLSVPTMGHPSSSSHPQKHRNQTEAHKYHIVIFQIRSWKLRLRPALLGDD